MATNIEIVRILMGDNKTLDEDTSIYTDPEIQVFIDLETVGSAVQLLSAAALGLESLANSGARNLEKVKETLNFKGDTRGLSKNLRDGAAALRVREASIPAGEFVETAYTEFSVLQILNNQDLRAGRGTF